MKKPLAILAGLLAAAPGTAADRPIVVKLEPPNMSADLDPKTVTRLAVTFDQPMSTSGWSWCGGGPSFPAFKPGRKPYWKDGRTCIVEVQLEPDHVYELSLNCPAGMNFRSAKGMELSPLPWTFATLPEKLPDPKEQRKRNQEALDALKEVLETRYSYYELRKLDWQKVWKQHSPAILASQTPRGWASAAGKALEPTQDIHLGIRYGTDWFVPAGRRSIDPLYRDAQARKRLAEMSPIQKGFAFGRTEDGIGYILIATWTQELDVAGVEEALDKLRGSRALIVDVRLNSGGDETLARRIGQWFVKGTKVYAKNRIRAGKGKDGFSEVYDRAITGNEQPERRLDVPLAVLIGPYVMSSCESFVMMMEQAPDSTTVGMTTYGSSGKPMPHELSNGVTALVPSWEDLFPDGKPLEGKGIVPEVQVQVTPADLERGDPILEKALVLLRKKGG